MDQSCIALEFFVEASEIHTQHRDVWFLDLLPHKCIYYFDGYGKAVWVSAVCIEMFCKERASVGSSPGNWDCLSVFLEWECFSWHIFIIPLFSLWFMCFSCGLSSIIIRNLSLNIALFISPSFLLNTIICDKAKIWTLCSGLLNVLFACHFSMRLHTRLFISLARIQISNSWTLEENWDRNGSLSLTHFLIPVFGQIIPPLIDLNQNRSKLKLYIGHLTALCHERDPHILQDLAPPSAYHRSQQDAWEEELQKMSPEQVRLGDINMGILFSLKYITFYCMYLLIMVTNLVFHYSQMCFSHYEKVYTLQ